MQAIPRCEAPSAAAHLTVVMQSRSHRLVHSAATVTERGIAALEALKGIVVLLIGAGFTVALHREHDVEEVARSLLLVLHLAKHHHLSAIFLRAADRLQDQNLVVIAAIAAAYTVLRFVEAFGLWFGRSWAEWFALISGSLYLPVEVYEIVRRPTPIRLVILLINVLIVAYMARLRLQPREERRTARLPA